MIGKQQTEYIEIIQRIKSSKTKPFNQKWITSLLYFMGILSIIAVFFIILFLTRESIPFLNNEQGFTLMELITDVNWHPEWDPPVYGAGGILLGSILVTSGAMLFAVPFGLGCAIFISEIAPPKFKVILKTAVELLAGIPSIVYGFFGLKILLPFLVKLFPEREKTGFIGSSWLAAAMVLGIMALPTIVSVTEDALSAVPHEYKEASLAMGATKWQTIRRVLIPSAISGITAAVILGMGRAIGETMAVMLVAGNSLAFPEGPWAIFERIRPITSTIAIEQKEAPLNSDWFHVLFLLGLILFIITLAINTTSNLIMKKINEKFQPPPKDEEIASLSKNSISYSVLRIPNTINGDLRIKNHSYSTEQLEKIQLSFQNYSKKYKIYGTMRAISFALVLISIVSVITLNFSAIFITFCLIVLGFIAQISYFIFFSRNLREIDELFHDERLNKYYLFFRISTFVRFFGLCILVIGLIVSLVNPLLMIILVSISTMIFSGGLFLENYAWARLRDFFIINPVIIKRKAIEGSRAMFISSLVRFTIMICVSIFCIIILISLTTNNIELLTWLDMNRVLAGLGILVFMVIILFIDIGIVSKLSKIFAVPITDKQQFIKTTILRILFIAIVSVFSLYAFNWSVIVVALPIFIGISYLMKKINPKVTQIISYITISFIALSVVVVLGILVFYIYKGGLEILGITVVISVAAIAVISILVTLFTNKFKLSHMLTWVVVLGVLTLITIPILRNNGWSLFGEEGFAFFYTEMKLSGDAGGILNQILGTVWLVLFTMLFAIPLGVLGGIYLAEYSKPGPLLNFIRTAIDNLNGTPSIVFGLFGWSFFVFALDFGISLLSGILTMSIMVLPTIMRVTEEAIRAVPKGLKEGSYAMGSTKWQSIRKVILPVARPSIITGIIISMGRVAGETAPVLLVAAAFQKRFTWGPFKLLGGSFLEPVQLLPYHILDLTTELQNPVRAGATALVLFLLVIILFTIATILRLKYRKAMK